MYKNDRDSKTGLRRHLLFLLSIVLLISLAYSNVLHGELQFDDKEYIFTTPLLQSPHAFKSMDLWEAFKGGLRPVTSFTFSLNYYFFGKDTFSYHLTNLSIHIINGVLVYLFIYITLVQNSISPTTPAPPYQGGDKCKVRDGRQWTAFLTALLFSLHPIQTESVSYIYQRAESLSSLFYLISLISFIIAVRQSEVKGLTTSIICYLIFIICFLLALGSKEIAITLPATAFLYGIFFFERKGLWKKIAIPGLFILAGLIVAAVRLTTLKGDPSAGYHLKEFTAWEYLLTQFSVISNYLRLLILPVGQNIDHAYPASRSILEARTILSIAFLSSLLVVASILYKRWRAGSFFILWFFIILLPSSSIVPLKDLLVEHRVYLSSVGVFFFLATGMFWLTGTLRERSNKRAAYAVFITGCALIMVILFSATYSRNLLWNREVYIWNDSIRKSPLNARAYNNLAVAYSGKDLFDKAIEQYLIALTLDPYNPAIHKGVGVAYSHKGEFDKALDHFQFAIRYKPEDHELHNSIGIAYANLDILDKALEHYQAALRLNPGYPDAHNEIGVIYEKQGRYNEAIQELQAAIKTKQGVAIHHYNLGNVYYRLKEFDEAIKHYQAAIRIRPDDPDAHNNLGYIYYEQGRLQEAEREIQAALKLKPGDSEALSNLELVHDKLKRRGES